MSPLAVRVVTSLRDPLTFPLPSKLCPQRVLAVSNLVAVPALPEHDEAIVAVAALPVILVAIGLQPISVPETSLTGVIDHLVSRLVRAPLYTNTLNIP